MSDDTQIMLLCLLAFVIPMLLLLAVELSADPRDKGKNWDTD
jgi:hypothetical protein